MPEIFLTTRYGGEHLQSQSWGGRGRHRSLRLQPAWFAYQVLGQPRLKRYKSWQLMDQWVRVLNVCMWPGSNPQHPHKRQTQLHIAIIVALGKKRMGPRNSLASQQNQRSKVPVQWEMLFPGNKVESNRGRYPAFSSGLFIHAQRHVYL